MSHANTATDLSGSAGDTGVSAALHQAPDELAQVRDQAAERARDLAGEARSELRRQADEQTTRVVDGLRRTAVQLDTMADANPDPDSPVAEAVRQIAKVGDRAGQRLETGGIDGVVSDVSDFARRHPATFLGVAFGVGILAGRLLRSDVEHRRDGADEDAPGSRTVVAAPEIDLRSTALGAPAPTTLGAAPEPTVVGATTLPGTGAV